MVRTKLIEFDFFKFKKLLDVAEREGHRIKPSAKAEWKQWIADNKIPEAGAMTIAKHKADKIEAAIISGKDDETDGFYVYSEVGLACWKVAKVEG